MTEWNVVLILGELIGLFLLVGRPILTLSKTIAEFNRAEKHESQSGRNGVRQTRGTQ